MRKFLALEVGWVRCAFYRCVKLPLDYERTVTQQCSDSYLCITVLDTSPAALAVQQLAEGESPAPWTGTFKAL